MEVATAAKLARALWIVPVTFVVAALHARGDRDKNAPPPKRPWFIAGFVAVAALVTFVPSLHRAGELVSLAAHRLLATTLFLIGLGLTRPALKQLGMRPLLQAVALWIFLGGATLLCIVRGYML